MLNAKGLTNAHTSPKANRITIRGHIHHTGSVVGDGDFHEGCAGPSGPRAEKHSASPEIHHRARRLHELRIRVQGQEEASFTEQMPQMQEQSYPGTCLQD